MAKWGEGDPRWIVEDRPDATNVNNWHWTEKNASQWSKDKLHDLLTDFEIEDGTGKVKLKEITKCEGEASASNRKAKLIFFYEWNIICSWEGQVRGCEDVIIGSIEIPNLSEEHGPEDVDVNVTITTGGEGDERLKQMMRAKGTDKIREQISTYITLLKEEFTSGMILPRKDGTVSVKNDLPKVDRPQAPKNSAATVQNDKTGAKFTTTKIKFRESFKCTAEEFYRVMTLSEMVQAFTQGPCKLDVKKGGKFELFSGNISGEFIELVPNKKIVQRWRQKWWLEGHYSTVTMDINQKDDCTEVNVVQESVPSTEVETTQEGWRRYYWESIKRTFGFGALLV